MFWIFKAAKLSILFMLTCLKKCQDIKWMKAFSYLPRSGSDPTCSPAQSHSSPNCSGWLVRRLVGWRFSDCGCCI